MNYNEFVDLVEKMRYHQKEFFRARKKEDLSESKRLEKAVDKAIQEFREGGVLVW